MKIHIHVFQEESLFFCNLKLLLLPLGAAQGKQLLVGHKGVVLSANKLLISFFTQTYFGHNELVQVLSYHKLFFAIFVFFNQAKFLKTQAILLIIFVIYKMKRKCRGALYWQFLCVKLKAILKWGYYGHLNWCEVTPKIIWIADSEYELGPVSVFFRIMWMLIPLTLSRPRWRFEYISVKTMIWFWGYFHFGPVIGHQRKGQVTSKTGQTCWQNSHLGEGGQRQIQNLICQDYFFFFRSDL